MTRLPSLGKLPARVRQFLTRGRTHKARLADIDIRIAVTGTRGKSTVTTWLYEALAARDYDVYAKVTGDLPHSLYDDERHPIERHAPVKLYETEREIRQYDPQDAIIVENQGIREYTTRLVNSDYVDATVVVLTNVRRDHLDTLGSSRLDIARAFARSIPPNTHVVSGERKSAVNEYLERELEPRGVTLTRVLEPDGGIETPVDELIAIVGGLLHVIDAEPLTSEERAMYRERMDVTWEQLPGGHIYNAASVNDVESTELIRRTLMEDGEDRFRPLVYFRRDRPGRTASFIEYLNSLAEAGLIDEVHALGAHRGVVTRSLTVPIVWHDEADKLPTDVLDEVIDSNQPVIVMGNTVPSFMQELRAEIQRRATLIAPIESEELEVDVASYSP
jgi:hypothetical protein